MWQWLTDRLFPGDRAHRLYTLARLDAMDRYIAEDRARREAFYSESLRNARAAAESRRRARALGEDPANAPQREASHD